MLFRRYVLGSTCRPIRIVSETLRQIGFFVVSSDQMSNRFQVETLSVVAEIRELFAQVIETRCPKSPGLADICSGFGIHRKLAWQLAKVAYGEDAFHAARYMPTPKAIETWVRASAERGVSPHDLERIREASDKFEGLVETHAGDRTRMDMLLESCVSEPSEEIDTRWRQRAFEGNSFIWGIHARCQVAFQIMTPSIEKPGWFDMAHIRGFIGFQRTRPGTRWTLAQGVFIHDNEDDKSPMRRPLDPSSASRAGGVPIIGAFTSSPQPPLARRQTGPRSIVDELLPGGIGQCDEQTIVMGEYLPAIGPAYPSTGDGLVRFGTSVGTPVEALYYDHFVHPDLFDKSEKELCVYNDMHNARPFADEDRLVVPERIASLGRGLSNVHTPDVPAYSKMLRYVFDRCGWEPDPYEHFRVRMAYPPLATGVMIRYKMHGAPGEPGA